MFQTEFFSDIVEAEWAVDVLRHAVDNSKGNDLSDEEKPAVGITMRIGPTGDLNGVTPQQCAVRLKERGEYAHSLKYSFLSLFVG